MSDEPERIWRYFTFPHSKKCFMEDEKPTMGGTEYIRKDLVDNGIEIYEAALRKCKKAEQELRDKLKARDEYIGQIEARTIKKGGLLRIAEKRIKELEGEMDV